MPNQPAAALIAANLASLTHPGGGKPVILPLPMFRSSGIPADQAEQFAKDAGLPHADISTLVAESVVHLLETNGYRIVADNDLAQLTAAATVNEQDRHREVAFYCSGIDGNRLFAAHVTEFDTGKVKISPQVIRALQQISPDCATGHPVSA